MVLQVYSQETCTSQRIYYSIEHKSECQFIYNKIWRWRNNDVSRWHNGKQQYNAAEKFIHLSQQQKLMMSIQKLHFCDWQIGVELKNYIVVADKPPKTEICLYSYSQAPKRFKLRFISSSSLKKDNFECFSQKFQHFLKLFFFLNKKWKSAVIGRHPIHHFLWCSQWMNVTRWILHITHFRVA